MKQFVGYLIRKAAGKKVSPTIKSVKPTKDIKGSVKRVYRDETSKRIDATTKVKEKMAAGKKMMREAQKERKKLVDTGRAFQFKNMQSYHPLKPGDKATYKDSMKVEGPQKKFKKGKELAKGGRVGLKAGTNPFKRKTNIDKIKETFAPKKRVNAKGGKLIGGQKNIDVAAPFGTINKKDFAKLRDKKTKKKVI